MEQCTAKIDFNATCANAKKGTKICKITLLELWFAVLGIYENHSCVRFGFDGIWITLASYLNYSCFVNVNGTGRYIN